MSTELALSVFFTFSYRILGGGPVVADGLAAISRITIDERTRLAINVNGKKPPYPRPVRMLGDDDLTPTDHGNGSGGLTPPEDSDYRIGRMMAAIQQNSTDIRALTAESKATNEKVDSLAEKFDGLSKVLLRGGASLIVILEVIAEVVKAFK
jgi:hypothetical protein